MTNQNGTNEFYKLGWNLNLMMLAIREVAFVSKLEFSTVFTELQEFYSFECIAPFIENE